MQAPTIADVSSILARDRPSLARALSLIENNRPGADELHARLLPHCGHAHVVGITGAPGAGKSTLINALLTHWRKEGRCVAVLAVDPSSPISGGAILGDRVRMADHEGGDDVFIRSISSRGHLGGLSQTAGKLIDAFDAAGFDLIIVETVGTGQSEVEISQYADTRLVICPPGLGDEVQTIKAGILEIADILVVNKCDLPHAQRTHLDLQALQAMRHPAASGWQVPVLSTAANSGTGIAELIAAFEEHARVGGIGQRLKCAPASRLHFDEFDCNQALGLTLGHSLDAGERKLKKGRVLNQDDIDALRRAGITHVIGARLSANDATEDAAAAAVCSLLSGANCESRKPYTGRCNLHATKRGILLIDAGTIERLNNIDEAVTVGTLPPWTPVRQGQVVATVKIVPLGVNRRILDLCQRTSATPPLQVAELIPHRAAMILSELPTLKPAAIASAVAVTRQRLTTLGSRLALELHCAHRRDALEDAIRQAMAAGCELILISGATVTKDRHDVAPAAIVAAGGRIERFGMPVEPGNMLLLAYIGRVPVIVLPGCARSRRLNGLDWVLHRLLAGLPVRNTDLAAMGVGGLIRSAPEEGDDETPLPTAADEQDGPHIAALVLAAGRSTRMGGSNKMFARVGGVPLALRARNAALASRAVSVTIVTGFEAEKVEALVATEAVTVVHNPDYAAGLSSSLRRGIATLTDDVDGVVVLLADMPHIDASHIDSLIEACQASCKIVVPMHAGRRGNPVIWPRRFFAALRSLEGDKGARELLVQYADEVLGVEMPDGAVFADVDTPADLPS